MREEEFFTDGDDDVFGLASRHLDEDLLQSLRTGPRPGHDDVELAVPLALLVHGELESYGTDGSNELAGPQMRLALLALKAVVDRIGITSFDVPFRDFTSFRSWWLRNDAHGSWQARRDLLATLFDPLHAQLALLEQRTLSSSLVEPVTPHPGTGWSKVDVEINELRRHFQSASSPQDCRNVGNDCVMVTESLSQQVYVAATHLRDGEQEPPVSNTKQRLDRYIEDAAVGSDNAALRKLAKAVIEFAQHVKHSATPTRTEAGIAADAVIQLANMLRRLSQDD